MRKEYTNDDVFVFLAEECKKHQHYGRNLVQVFFLMSQNLIFGTHCLSIWIVFAYAMNAGSP